MYSNSIYRYTAVYRGMYIQTNLNAFVYPTCAYKTLSKSSPLYVHGDIIQLV